MKGKVNVKTIVILAVILVVIILGVVGAKTVQTFMSGASSSFEPIGVTAVSAVDGKTATISWTSDKACLAKVEYGTMAASLVLMAVDSDSVTSHRVSLSSLRPGTTYYYRIKVGDDIFDNNGIPYTFKTKGSSSTKAIPSVSPIVTTVPLTSSNITCKSGVDYNKDGTINSMDILDCKKDGGTMVSTTPVPTSTVVASCSNNIDYNSDGVVNSLDRLNCLQSLN